MAAVQTGALAPDPDHQQQQKQVCSGVSKQVSASFFRVNKFLLIH
jgi:hypothetical protein